MRTYRWWNRVAGLTVLVSGLLIALSTAVQLHWTRADTWAAIQPGAAVDASCVVSDGRGVTGAQANGAAGASDSPRADSLSALATIDCQTQRSRRILLLALVLVGLSLPLAVLMARSLRRPWVDWQSAMLAGRERAGDVPATVPQEWLELIERHRSQSVELAALQAELQALHAACRHGVFRTNASGQVLTINTALADLLGGSIDTVLDSGRLETLLEMPEADRPIAAAGVSSAPGETSAASPGEERRDEAGAGPAVHSRFVRVTRSDQSARSAVLRRVPIHAEGRLIGYTGTVEDVSERLGSAENRRMLAAIVEHGADLIVVIDRHARISYANRAARVFWGMPADGTGADDNLLTYLSAEHGARLIDVALPAAQADGGWVGEDRIAGVDGQSIPVAQRLIAGRLADDDARSYALILRDLSLEWAAEHSHDQIERRVRTIVEAIPALVAYVDPRERFRFANRAYRDWLGLDPSRMIGSTLREQYGPDVYQRLGEPLRPAFDGEIVEYECALDSLNHVKDVHVIALPDRDLSGRIVGVHVLVHDIPAKRLEERRLLKLSLCDPLTGLPDSQGFEEAFDEAVMRADATEAWLGLLRVDVDDLDRLQRSLGQTGVDTVLREVGARLRAAVRRADQVCRIAPEGFAIILDALSRPADAAIVADKIVDVMRVPFFVAQAGDDGSVRLSVNVGVATYGRAARSAPSEILAQAEVALIESKRAGRDRVSFGGFPG